MTLGRVMVRPRWKGKGFAKKTIFYGIEYMTKNIEKYKIELEVLNANSNAIKFYKKLGFIDAQFARETRTMELRNI